VAGKPHQDDRPGRRKSAAGSYRRRVFFGGGGFAIGGGTTDYRHWRGGRGNIGRPLQSGGDSPVARPRAEPLRAQPQRRLGSTRAGTTPGGGGYALPGTKKELPTVRMGTRVAGPRVVTTGGRDWHSPGKTTSRPARITPACVGMAHRGRSSCHRPAFPLGWGERCLSFFGAGTRPSSTSM
jgi:hypothetical protein